MYVYYLLSFVKTITERIIGKVNYRPIVYLGESTGASRRTEPVESLHPRWLYLSTDNRLFSRRMSGLQIIWRTYGRSKNEKNFPRKDSDDRPIRTWNRTGDVMTASGSLDSWNQTFSSLTWREVARWVFVIRSFSYYAPYEVRIDSVAIGAWEDLCAIGGCPCWDSEDAPLPPFFFGRVVLGTIQQSWREGEQILFPITFRAVSIENYKERG